MTALNKCMEHQIVLNCWSASNFHSEQLTVEDSHCLEGCKLQHLANCLSTFLGKEEERVKIQEMKQWMNVQKEKKRRNNGRMNNFSFNCFHANEAVTVHTSTENNG